MKLTGAQALVESLRRENVEVIFGYPGGAIMPVYDVIYQEGFRHILTRHEQAAAHAADGYARSTGKPGVCMATSGPGATNLVTGLATAYMDSAPVIAFTGQVATSLLGKDSFQEADITGITMPITKHNYLVKRVEDLPRVIKEAFFIATTGRPGPVLIDLPKDIFSAQLNYSYPGQVNLPSYKPVYNGNTRQIKAVAAAIRQAKQPVLHIGGGVTISGAEKELLKLAEKTQIPVTATLMGLSAFPGNHRLFLGMPGMHGTVAANYALTECDLLIAVGTRFDDRVTGRLDTFASKARVVHVDIDPAEIGKNIRVEIPIVGDVKTVLTELESLLPSSLDYTAWHQKVENWKEENPLSYSQNGEWVPPQLVLETINELTGGEAIITTEVGQNQMWAAQYLRCSRPRSFITSGGLGTMGFGFPAAIGAQIGNPDHLVIDIAGDGSIQMNIQELATIANYELPVKIIILNNNYLGMVRQWQELFFERRYAETHLKNPDFRLLAKAYGVRAFEISQIAQVKEILEEAFAHPGPALVDCRINPEENVLPMVPPNKSINQMIGVKEG